MVTAAQLEGLHSRASLCFDICESGLRSKQVTARKNKKNAMRCDMMRCGAVRSWEGISQRPKESTM